MNLATRFLATTVLAAVPVLAAAPAALAHDDGVEARVNVDTDDDGLTIEINVGIGEDEDLIEL